MNEKKSRLMDIVGEDGVSENPELGISFSLDHNLKEPLKPSFTVKPKNVKEVQQIVLWANKTQTSLVPISSGEPHFRGDTDPTAPEAVVVDLSGMKRILKINRRNRLALRPKSIRELDQLQAILNAAKSIASEEQHA